MSKLSEALKKVNEESFESFSGTFDIEIKGQTIVLTIPKETIESVIKDGGKELAPYVNVMSDMVQAFAHSKKVDEIISATLIDGYQMAL